MQLTQLLHGDGGRRAHEKILGTLVHREKHDLAQIFLPREQHDDAIDAGRDPAMRRRAILKRAVHAAEFFEQHILAIARESESLLHNVGAVVPDRPRRQLDAIADNVILKRLDREDGFLIGGVECDESIVIEVRHRKRIVRKVDFLFVLIPLIHREIDDPAELEDVFLREAELVADLEPRRPGEFGGFFFLVASEEHRVAGVEAGLFRDFRLHFGGEKFGDGTFAEKAAVCALKNDIPKPRGAFALCPIIELVEKGARLLGRRPAPE